MELRKELSTLTALELPATLVFDYPSVAEMTTALAAMLPAVGATNAALHPRQAAQAQAAPRLNGQHERAAATPNENSASHWLPQVGSPQLTQIPASACLQTWRKDYRTLQALNQQYANPGSALRSSGLDMQLSSCLMCAGARRHQGHHGR